jgi:hypothetical protein
MAAKVPKHECEWYPIAYSGGQNGTAYDFIPRTYAKPRGFKPPEAGDPVLWACAFRYTAKEEIGGRPVWRSHRCTKTLNYVEAFRLRTKGVFEEVRKPDGIT